MEDARKRAPELKKQFRERELEIAKVRAERLEAKRAKMKKKEEDKANERLRLQEQIEDVGLWKSEEAVTVGLAKVKESARGEGKGKLLEALKRQINFRRKVLRQPILDPKDWAFSEGQKLCDVATLKAKLLKIIGQAPKDPNDANDSE